MIWMEEAGVDADLRPDMMILKTSGSEVTRHTFASVSDHSTRRGARRARTIAHTQNPPPGAKTTTKRICNKQQAENLCASLCAAARLAPNPHGLAVREVSVALSRSLLRLLALSLSVFVIQLLLLLLLLARTSLSVWGGGGCGWLATQIRCRGRIVRPDEHRSESATWRARDEKLSIGKFIEQQQLRPAVASRLATREGFQSRRE